MRKKIFFIICCLSLLVSCDKFFLDIEGQEADLQGKWQMDNVDTVYYNFQKNLFQYQIYQKKDNMSYAFGYYILRGDTIDLELLSAQSSLPLDHLGWDTLYTEDKQATLYKSFKIEKLTSKKLILSSYNDIISLHKF